MIRKMLSLMLLAILVALAGTACKKESPDSADNKSYLVDPNSGTTPQAPVKPGPGTDPCLKKGAIGVQALLTKADCPKLTIQKCGNGNPEGDEQCDEGAKNGLAGSKCTIDCKKVADKKESGGSGGDSGKVLKITTQSMPDKSLGDKYTATIKASGGKNSKDYKWLVSNLPDGFESKSSNDSVTISSKSALTKAGTYKPSVKVCLISKPEECATCSEGVCSFNVVDRYNIAAYALPYKSSSDNAICNTENTGTCEYVLKAEGDVFKGIADSYYVAVLQVSSDKVAQPQDGVFFDKNFNDWGVNLTTKEGVFKDIYLFNDKQGKDDGYAYVKKYEDLYYKWSMTVNGKAVPFVRSVDYYGGDADTKKKISSLVSGSLFLMDSTNDMKSHLIYPEWAYIMAGPNAMGTKYENVIITVESKHGGTQKIIFDKFVLPTLQQIATAKLAKQLEEDKKNPCYGKTALSVPTVTVDGNTIKSVPMSPYTKDTHFTINGHHEENPEIVFDIVGGMAPYTAKLEIKDTPSYWTDKPVTVDHTLDSEWSLKVDDKKINMSGGFSYGSLPSLNISVSEKIRIDVSDQCGNQVSAVILFLVTPPDYKVYKISNVKLLVDFRTEWTDEDSKIKFEIYNSAGQLLAKTAEASANGADPTCFNKYYDLTVTPGHENDSIDTISKVRLGGIDNGSVDMTLYFKFLRLEVKDNNGSIIWYATAPGDFWHDDNGEYDNDGSWEYNDITAFTKNPSNGSIWFYGEPPHHSDEGGGGSCDEWIH